MGLAQPVHRLTEAEYLEIERRAEFKSEFFDGEMFAIAGGNPTHSLLAANVIREIGNRLQGRCAVFTSDLRVKVEATGLHTYPDVTVVCGERRFTPDGQMLVNPTALVEILSDETEAYDRGKRFEHYRQIPSLREYLLVSQREPGIEHFVRQAAGQWLLSEASGLAAELALPSLEITLPLAGVFAQVEFAPRPIRAASPSRL